MNIDKLRKQLEIDEGVKYEVYLDHLGKKTFGIGHLTISGDPENSDVSTAYTNVLVTLQNHLFGQKQVGLA